MEENVIKITEKELKQIICESVSQILDDIQPKQSARLDEMSRVGFIDGTLESYVWTDDPGKIPHVHIRDTNSRGQNFETCVRLDKAEYFFHGHYRGRLNSKQRKELAEFMRSKPKNPRYNTFYEVAVDMWNFNNSDVEITPQYDANGNVIIPDYENLQ